MWKCSFQRPVTTNENIGKEFRIHVLVYQSPWMSCYLLSTVHSDFLRALEKLQKAIISFGFVMSVRLSVSLSVRPHGTTRLLPDRFSLNLIFEYSSKNCGKSKFHWNLTRITRVYVYIHEDISLSSSYNEKYIRENLLKKSFTVCLITFYFRKPCRLWDNVEKYCIARHATDGSMIWGTRITCWITRLQTHTHYIILHYCFSTAKTVTWMRLNGTL